MWRKAGRDVYCYFDNDEKGYAALDARRLIEMVEGSNPGRAAGRTVAAQRALTGSAPVAPPSRTQL